LLLNFFEKCQFNVVYRKDFPQWTANELLCMDKCYKFSRRKNNFVYVKVPKTTFIWFYSVHMGGEWQAPTSSINNITAIELNVPIIFSTLWMTSFLDLITYCVYFSLENQNWSFFVSLFSFHRAWTDSFVLLCVLYSVLLWKMIELF
jgi:hypothetical protein